MTVRSPAKRAGTNALTEFQSWKRRFTQGVSLAWIADVLGAEVIGDLSASVFGVCTDTRQGRDGTLFFALQGENADGHRFVRAGARSRGRRSGRLARSRRRRRRDAAGRAGHAAGSRRSGARVSPAVRYSGRRDHGQRGQDLDQRDAGRRAADAVPRAGERKELQQRDRRAADAVSTDGASIRSP